MNFYTKQKQIPKIFVIVFFTNKSRQHFKINSNLKWS